MSGRELDVGPKCWRDARASDTFGDILFIIAFSSSLPSL